MFVPLEYTSLWKVLVQGVNHVKREMLKGAGFGDQIVFSIF